MSAIACTDSLALNHTVDRKINEAQHTGVVSALYRGHDIARDVPNVERPRAFGQSAQALCIVGVFQDMPLCHRLTVGQEIRPRCGMRRQPFGVSADRARHPWAHGKPTFRQCNRLIKKTGPFRPAPFFMGGFHQHRRARRANGPPTDHRIKKPHGFAVFRLKEPRRGRKWRCFATIQGGGCATLCIIPNQERAPAQTGALRLNQAQHGLHRHHGVRRRSALSQHTGACINGQRVRGRNHPVLGLRRSSSSLLRLRLRRRVRGRHLPSPGGFWGHCVGCLLSQSDTRQKQEKEQRSDHDRGSFCMRPRQGKDEAQVNENRQQHPKLGPAVRAWTAPPDRADGGHHRRS